MMVGDDDDDNEGCDDDDDDDDGGISDRGHHFVAIAATPTSPCLKHLHPSRCRI